MRRTYKLSQLRMLQGYLKETFPIQKSIYPHSSVRYSPELWQIEFVWLGGAAWPQRSTCKRHKRALLSSSPLPSPIFNSHTFTHSLTYSLSVPLSLSISVPIYLSRYIYIYLYTHRHTLYPSISLIRCFNIDTDSYEPPFWWCWS